MNKCLAISYQKKLSKLFSSPHIKIRPKSQENEEVTAVYGICALCGHSPEIIKKRILQPLSLGKRKQSVKAAGFNAVMPGFELGHNGKMDVCEIVKCIQSVLRTEQGPGKSVVYMMPT